VDRRLDVLFVNADSAASAYQDLSKEYSAIEPPTWSLLLAQSCRAKGFGVAILDPNAERLTTAETVSRIHDVNARLVCFVVYGQNPNSGTTNMVGNLECCALLKDSYPQIRTCFVGSHTSALPLDVLSQPYVDFVLLNEGVYALHNLLRTDLNSDLHAVNGIGYKSDGRPVLNAPQSVVPQDRMDTDLPGYAWDLLPYRERPLDLYRSHFWHAEYNHTLRTPFAAIYTSLGCGFKCNFCMINIVNRVDNSEGVVASNSPGMRFWSSGFMLGEIEKLANLGVETVRISDEMFFLNKMYFEPLLQGIIDRGIPLRTWSYARVDTVREKYLDLFRKAGVQWLGIGIESGDQVIRQEVSKGTFKVLNIRDVVRSIQGAGINVGANYIFGFPDDTIETMQKTLDLSLELCTEFANFYPCQALPGSELHNTARKNGWKLPDTLAGYGFLSYDCEPLPTRHLTAAQVLEFRDNAWHTYFAHEPYLELVARKFGAEQRRNVETMATIRLKRRLLGH
jgi:anaerobic magnesium-protoporphyrin IX monomethyl ester cyclase